MTTAKRAGAGMAKRTGAKPRGRGRRTPSAQRPGRLIAIGGGEERSPEGAILSRVVEASGGARARIIICGGASDDPGRTLEEYRRVFSEIGAHEVTTEALQDRAAAEGAELLRALEHATAVFFSGGDQLRLTAKLGGTAFGEGVRSRLQSGGLVVAGTSAGAAAMSSVMIIGGAENGTVRRADTEVAPGLGYWRDTVLDTHFNQRGRVHRLLTLFAENPQVLGVGLDENTAAEVEPGSLLRVIGSGAVVIFDGRVTYSNVAEADREDVLSLHGARLHVLSDGHAFDLARRRPLRPHAAD